jgi:Flp pilus assembly protein TadD
LEKKDSDGAIAELREALRLKSSDAAGHFFLAGLLQQKGQLEEALEQYRAVHELQPAESVYRFRYEKLSHQLKEAGRVPRN